MKEGINMMENFTVDTKNILNKLYIYNENQLYNILKNTLKIKEIIDKYRLYVNNLKTIEQFEQKIEYLYNFEKNNRFLCLDLQKQNDKLKKELMYYDNYEYFKTFSEEEYYNDFYYNCWIDYYKFNKYSNNNICITKKFFNDIKKIDMINNKNIFSKETFTFNNEIIKHNINNEFYYKNIPKKLIDNILIIENDVRYKLKMENYLIPKYTTKSFNEDIEDYISKEAFNRKIINKNRKKGMKIWKKKDKISK